MTMKQRSTPTSNTVWHWRWQRITAILLIFLCSRFVISLVNQLVNADIDGVKQWLNDPLNAALTAAMLLAGFVHQHIGVHEIMTDYIHCRVKKRISNFLNDAVTLGLLLGSLAAIGTIYFGGAL